jgi:hypothetical protein
MGHNHQIVLLGISKFTWLMQQKIHFQALATTVWLAGARATPILHLQEYKN